MPATAVEKDGPARIAVFASGGGTNLQALIDHFNAGPVQAPRPASEPPARVHLVVSDRPSAGALDRAQRAGIPGRVIEVAHRPEDEVAAETLEALDAEQVDIVALAGYLRLVPAAVVRRYRGRMLNIHPALLPAFGGKGMYGIRVHRAVLEAGCRVSGATVHLVDERYDTGPVVAQWPVPVLEADDPETLAARILRVEHLLYPAAVELLARRVHSGGSLDGRSVGLAAGDPRAFVLEAREAPAEAMIREALGLE